MDQNLKAEMIESFEREGLDIESSSDPIMFFPFIKQETKDLKIAQEIVKEYGCELKLYMPGSKIDDKDAEYEIVERG